MIFLDSRNSDGYLFKAMDSRTGKYQLTVLRQWPYFTKNYFFYEWIDGDRLDNLAAKYLGKSELWWQIMDMNPEIITPHSILPGTKLRVPSA